MRQTTDALLPQIENLLQDNYRCRTEAELCSTTHKQKMCCDGFTCRQTRHGPQSNMVYGQCVPNEENLPVDASCARSKDCVTGFCSKQLCEVASKAYGVDCEKVRGKCAFPPETFSRDRDFSCKS